MNFLDRKFEITKRGSTFSTELVSGLATFLAMSYILAVNPTILSAAGIDKGTLITVTALASAVGCFFVAFSANLPIVLAPAMGANSFFAFIVCLASGIDWRSALGLVFYNGIIFLVISITNLRKKIIMSVPSCIRVGLQAGIGFFIAYLGLQYSKIIVADKYTISSIGKMGCESLLALFGLLAMSAMAARKFKGAVITTIMAITVISFFLVDSTGKPIAKIPEKIFSLPHGISETFFQLDLLFPFREPMKALPLIFVLLILDMFDTIATLIATGRASGLMDKQGNMPRMSRALASDATATITGALLGTSTTGAYVESAVGIEAGARTGLSTAFVGVLMVSVLIFTPILECVPSIAIAPVLMFVGVLMSKCFADLDFSKISEVAPAVICMMIITFSFKISLGFSFGIIAYVVIKLIAGQSKEIAKPVWVMSVMASVFLIAMFY